MQIQKLEADLGVRLLERGKKIRLTETGRLFYEQSLQIVQKIEQLQSTLSDMRQGEAGEVRIGATEPIASYRLPEILKSFLFPISENPGFGGNRRYADLTERLRKGEIDFALCSPPDLGPDTNSEPLWKETFVILMPEDHPLAQKTSAAPGDLCEHRLIVTSATCPYRKRLEAVLRESGKTLSDTLEIGSMTALESYVKSGLGIAFVPEMMAKSPPAGTTTRALNGGPIEMTHGILYKLSDFPLNFARAKLYQFLKQELAAEKK